MPKISVVMSTYNRPKYVKEAIESILNQTYTDFEFIIIDDCSTDNTADIINKYVSKDERIIFVRNKTNRGLIYSLNHGFTMAKGEYIARMDDDDISEPTRFEKQVKYLDEHPDVIVLGTFIKTFGDPDAKSWVNMIDSDELEVAMNFYNPMCHPSVMIRKEFLKKHNLTYSPKELYAEEYHLWKEIILRGGKLSNIPEALLNYRCHKKSVIKASKSGEKQHKTAERIRTDLLNRFYHNKNIVKKIRKNISKYPFDSNNKKKIGYVLEQMKKFPDIIPLSGVEKFEKRYCGVPCTMEIFFASDDNFVQHLCVAMASILIKSLPIEKHSFYILDGGINEENKEKINKLKSIKDCKIEFIKVDDSLFDCCPLTPECKHITKQTYYRYIIPKLKPEIKKCFYLDCDIVVEDSLNEFWNINLGDNYVAAVEEFWDTAHQHYTNNGIEKSFNAGIILINSEQWQKDNITEKLFKNTVTLAHEEKVRWVDQCVLNFTFNNRVRFVHPKYNLQQRAYSECQHSLYSDKEMNDAKSYPVIIHFSGNIKPWQKNCTHPKWKRYYHYLKFTAYKKEYYTFKAKRILRNISSLIYRKKVSSETKEYQYFGITLFKKRRKIT